MCQSVTEIFARPENRLDLDCPFFTELVVGYQRGVIESV